MPLYRGPARYFEKYMAWCEDFYGGGNFRALQMIIPKTAVALGEQSIGKNSANFGHV